MNAGGQVIEVAAGVIFRSGRLLLTQRRAQDHLGGLWEFPGGKREEGESYAECLERELKEELGIEVEIGGVIDAVTHEYPGKTVHLEFLHCKWLRHEPRALGCEAFAWVRREELDSYAFPAADQQILKQLREDAGLWL